MMEFRYSGEELWNRMERAVERVNERLRKTVQILEDAKVPSAIVGGQAVRASKNTVHLFPSTSLTSDGRIGSHRNRFG